MAMLTKGDNAVRTRPGTLSALRSPNFRLYFGGQLVSVSGTWMQSIAQGFLVFSLTRSELWLGVVACATGLPMVLMSPIAGVIVERIPRKRLMMITQTIQMILAFILTALTFTGTVQVWHIVGLAFILGITNSLDMPARQSFIVEMVGREDLHSGIALNSILNSTGRVLGPTAAGLALVQWGPAWCFFINGASFLAVLLSLFLIRVPHVSTGLSKTSALTQLKEGLSYARNHPLIAPLLLLAAVIGLFVVPTIQLMPAFADLALNSPKEGYAALSSAQGLGSVIGGAAVGWLTHRLGNGKSIALALGLSSISSVLLSMQTTIPLASLFSGLMGLFLILQLVCVNTWIQMIVPNHFRGRVLSLYTLALLGLAPFGALALGAIANVIGTSTAIALYGVLSGVGGALVLLRWSNLLRAQETELPEEAEAEIVSDTIAAPVVAAQSASD